MARALQPALTRSRAWALGSQARTPLQDVRLSRSGSTIADTGSDALGDVDAGGTAYVYTLHNDGADALTVASVATGTLSNVTSATVSGITTPVVVAPGGSTTFTVTVTPTAAGACSYTLTVTSDDPDAEAVYTVSVSGTGTGFEASYSTWTEWTYAMFGAGAPDHEGTPAEYSSMSYSDGVGWNPTATYAAERDVSGEGTAWFRAPTVVWADAPTDYSLGMDVLLTPVPTLTNREVGIAFGAAANDADTVWGGLNSFGASKAVMVGAGTGSDSNGGSGASHAQARVLHFPLPGSGRNRVGVVVTSPRTSAGATVATTGYHMSTTGSTGTESTHKVGPWWGSAGGSTTGASGPTRIRARGFLMPRAPWDGGTVGASVGEWKLLTYDGSAPSVDTSTVYVSNGGAGDEWDVTLDATKGQAAGNGWDPAAGSKRPYWIVAAPTGLVVDGSRPILVAIEPQSGWATADQCAIGVVAKPSGTMDGEGVLLTQPTSTTKGHMAWADDTGSGASSGTTVTGVVGGLVQLVGQSGTKYLGSAWVAAYRADGPDTLALGSNNSDGLVTFSGNLVLIVVATNGVAGSTNRRIEAKIWLCNPDIDLTAGP